MSSYKTYRVQGIPGTLTRENCRMLLNSVLKEENVNLDLVIHSLGPDPVLSEFQVATITFRQVPKCLQDNKEEWTIPLTNFKPSNDETTLHSITVDSHFLGFTPLNYINESSDNKTDCIAITGLGSHPFGSWKQRNGQHMWLRDSLPQDLDGARVLLYGYNTSLNQSQTFQNIDDIAVAFSEGIRSIRRHNSGAIPRPLIFISHSLGGVILKRAIIEMKNGDQIDREIFNAIYSVLFFGVPNQGIRVDHWLPLVKGQPNENLIRDLGCDSTYLRRLHEDFLAVFSFEESEIVSIYETERTRVVKEESPGKWALTGNYEVLVPIPSATDFRLRTQGYHILPIKQNHSDMVKFSSRFDENYKLIASYLKEFSANSTKAIRIRFLRTQGANANTEAVDNKGWTRLHHAAFRGHENGLNDLIAVSTSIEARDIEGRTPLHIAACYGHDAVVEILLEYGADIDARNHREETPLCNAASGGYMSIVRMLVDREANLEARDTEGKTPLYSAARYGHEPVVRLLVGRDANKEAKASGGWSPLHAAAWYGHEAVARALVEAGADKEARNGDGSTPLYIAASTGHDRVTRLLLQQGANKHPRTSGGWTPLHAATWFGHERASRVLVENGANMELRSEDSETPLFIAARNGHEAIVRLLVENGADKKARICGWTPFQVAKSNGHIAVAKVLKGS